MILDHGSVAEGVLVMTQELIDLVRQVCAHAAACEQRLANLQALDVFSIDDLRVLTEKDLREEARVAQYDRSCKPSFL